MNNFSISQLAQLSGIKAHTIRIWEQRYDALQPERSEGNTRYYSGNELRRLLNISSLSGTHKVSDLCRMTNKELSALVKELYIVPDTPEINPFVSQLIAAGTDFNQESFEHILNHCLLRFGTKKTYQDVLYPLLQRTGLLWAAQQMPPAHEHFMTQIIRQKLIIMADALPLPPPNAKRWILFLPEDEHHECGLLMASYILRSAGQKVYYFGGSIPQETLTLACKEIRPDALLLFFVHSDFPENFQSYLSEISKKTKIKNIFYCGSEQNLGEIKSFPNCKWLQKMEDLESQIETV